jgi:N-acetylglucosaminyldiphosphoundecaprenol N-acetyl-beta-D-mannosaminyltransferase
MVYLFDTTFCNDTREEACDRIENHISNKSGFVYIAVKDVALTIRSIENPFLKDFYHSVPTCTFVDGRGILYASRLLGQPLKEMVGGPGIYYDMLRRGEQKGYRFYFLGADEEVLRAAIHNVLSRHPRVDICGHHSGYFSSSEEKTIVSEIGKSGCDILLLGMSTPKREEFVSRHLGRFGSLVCIAVGGVFDNEAGKTVYAPSWVGILGLEWLFRVAQEPKRLAPRYLRTHSKFIFYLISEMVRKLRTFPTS